jgi:cobalt-zinc-cadmium efflux system outer membrane protein
LGVGYGYVVGVSVEVPIFDRGQTLQEETEAQAALASARAQALQGAIEVEIRSASVAYLAARREFERFEAQTRGHLEVLLVAAQSGYREGERSIVELLDAQRAQTEIAEHRLLLLAKAKRAEARLRAAVGDLR